MREAQPDVPGDEFGFSEELIPAALAGERLDRVVSMVTGESRAEATRLVEDGRIMLDGVVTTTRSCRVREGQRIRVPLIDVNAPVLPKSDPRVEVHVVHADPHVIVVDKDAGIVVHPGSGNPDGTLVNGLLARFPELAGVGDPQRPGIVHRLDKETSGLMIVARSDVAYRALVAALSAHEVDRRYLALVWGSFDSPRGAIDAPIGRSTRSRTKMALSVDGRAARTEYEVLRTFSDPVSASLVACRLTTGRTHQIRVHMSSIGHSVVGDDLYNGARETLVPPRMFLHSTSLEFEHPVTGEQMRFESPLPAELNTVISTLH